MKVDIFDLANEISGEIFIQLADSMDDASVMDGKLDMIESAIEDTLQAWVDDGKISFGS